jgi:hypothetical protein
MRFRAVEPERERVIAQLAAGRMIAATAFDGPIGRGFDIIGRYRTAERMLTRRLRPLIGKPGQSSAPVGRLLSVAVMKGRVRKYLSQNERPQLTK